MIRNHPEELTRMAVKTSTMASTLTPLRVATETQTGAEAAAPSTMEQISGLISQWEQDESAVLNYRTSDIMRLRRGFLVACAGIIAGALAIGLAVRQNHWWAESFRLYDAQRRSYSATTNQRLANNSAAIRQEQGQIQQLMKKCGGMQRSLVQKENLIAGLEHTIRDRSNQLSALQAQYAKLTREKNVLVAQVRNAQVLKPANTPIPRAANSPAIASLVYHDPFVFHSFHH